MARKRNDAGDKGPRKSPAREPRQPVVSIKARPAWKAWLDDLAAYDRSTVNDLIDRALVRYAKSIGYDKEPPER